MIQLGFQEDAAEVTNRNRLNASRLRELPQTCARLHLRRKGIAERQACLGVTASESTRYSKAACGLTNRIDHGHGESVAFTCNGLWVARNSE